MLKTLEWLPRPAGDFRDRWSALRRQVAAGDVEDLAPRILSLATATLDEIQLNQLAKLANEISAADVAIEGFNRARIGMLGDATLSLLAPAIRGSGLRHGLLLDIVEGEYDSAVQEATDRSGRMHRAGLAMALIAPDARMLGLDQAAPSAEAGAAKVEAASGRLRLIIDGLRPGVSSSIFVQTLAPPVEPLFGSFDRLEPGSPFAMIEAVNAHIAEWAAGGEIILVDIARLAASVGLERWHEPRHWHASKLPFSPEMIPVHADVVARTIAAALGRSRKCLVLDLDNTLWGGVIGDDGVVGIELGQGSAGGEAFLAVQRIALELRGRGVILAVCSKNDDEVARAPFREHPEMLLREDHIAVFQANWTDKAANLRAIAETLNIGLDALVLLDDNPAERMQVRRELPQVAVPELPDDPAFYPRTLAAAGYFEAVSLSKEDRERASYYQANARRTAALTASGDLDGYLASLDMVCTIAMVDPVSRPRVTQLINKSNQFNLTTRRYSESEVAAAEVDPSRHIIQVRLADRFGDNGIVSVIIADKKADRWEIDTWLMSCRVLGRRVQEAVLTHLAAAARSEGAEFLLGRYLPTPKNRLVADHFEKLGFVFVEALGEGGSVWRLDLAGYVAPKLPIRIADHALEPAAFASA
jgi:FkbH-like protein